MAGARVHEYRVSCSWSGSTGAGYEAYSRNHEAHAGPVAVTVSADPAFRGDPQVLNPEQLVVLAAASCQLLSFLAVAARARIDVVRYDDDAEAVMDEGDRPVRLNRIRLRPRIEVARANSRAQVERLVEVAHRECYIANSLKTEILVEPAITLR